MMITFTSIVIQNPPAVAFFYNAKKIFSLYVHIIIVLPLVISIYVCKLYSAINVVV